ncbi:hypothetical protein PPTG_22013 [Phytophthora nicotianae INRA-310]|uniref:Uncharacterized protein n=1 Tax=Phytophthora nicotianae (strain INRA-310) TaxID=761204 RepID=W2QRE2_PHYN3|nr:hypothetical protein PPTG_22013 [Phytophthora nicotianae INRA-310]ETN14800.1 hypothetical protein PPTG_22013 [Phytophthora nicotianae INRA-310]
MSAPILSIDTQHEDMIHDAQLDYYGKRLATCSSDRTIKVYDVTGDVQNNEQILTGHEGPVWQVSWAHPKFGVLLAACSYDGKVIIYREQSLNQWTQAYVHAFHESSVNSIAWAPHEYGLALACASADGTVSVLSYSPEGWSVSHFKDSALGCNAVSWAPFNSVGSQGPSGPIRRVVTASCDKTIKIWSLPEGESEWTKQELSAVPAHSDWVRDVAWAPSTGLPVNLIASCSEDKHVYIWSQTAEDSSWKRELLHTFDAPVWRVSWSVTGNVLAVSSGDHKVTLWKETLDKKWMYIALQLQEAKQKSAAKDKRGAIFALKRKKMYEAEVEKLQGARMTLETQVMTLESAHVNMETFTALRSGAEQMKAIHGQMNVDKVDNIMDDIQEEMATADEIGRAISQPLGSQLYDDDELEDELREMEELELEEKTLEPVATTPAEAAIAPPATAAVAAAAAAATAPSAPPAAMAQYNLPDVPTHAVESNINVVGNADEDELEALRKLEASMAL